VLARLPLFPLSTVLYPGLVLPLHIFEARYRTLVADLTTALDEGGSRERGFGDDAPEFGVIAIRSGQESGTAALPTLHGIGCSAAVRQVEPLPDGRFDLVTSGTRRFRVHTLDPTGPYLVAEVEYLPEEIGTAPPPLCAAVRDAYLAYREQLLDVAGQAPRVRGTPPTEPIVLSYLVAAAMLLDLTDKQRLLEAPDAGARLRAELALLRRERLILDRLPSVPATDLVTEAGSPN
jgi:uncharacterized protein